MNSLVFWATVFHYHSWFIAETLDAPTLESQAKDLERLFATWITNPAEANIKEFKNLVNRLIKIKETILKTRKSLGPISNNLDLVEHMLEEATYYLDEKKLDERARLIFWTEHAKEVTEATYERLTDADMELLGPLLEERNLLKEHIKNLKDVPRAKIYGQVAITIDLLGKFGVTLQDLLNQPNLLDKSLIEHERFENEYARRQINVKIPRY